ncbi:MAG: hypothetical protein MK085_04870 [Phycisphaerales bacterium]|nr:hypothetical protein [Phycisphaerales bacterium]
MADAPVQTTTKPSSRSFLALAVHSQVLMAMSAAALVFASTRVLGVTISGWWYLVAGLGTWMIYLLDSARSMDAEDLRSQPRRAAMFRNHPFLGTVLPWLAGFLAVVATLLARPTWSMCWLLAGLGLIGLAYAIPVLPATTASQGRTARRTLKQFAGLKPVTICVAWTGGAVLLPLLGASSGYEGPSWVAGWLVALLFLLLLADTMLLDLRDRDGDQEQGLRTVAVRIGPTGTHLVVASCLGLAAVVLLAGGAEIPSHHLWLRIGLAGILGVTIPWLAWPSLRGHEVGTALGLMAWRFLAALAAI